MRKLLLFLAFCLPCLSQTPLASQTTAPSGTIDGVLQGDDESLLSYGSVSLLLLPPYQESRSLKNQWTTSTSAFGEFQCTGLQEGTYQLCHQAGSSTWLSSCEWAKPSVVTLSSALPNANVTTVLKKGVALPIRVSDPGQFLSQNEGKTPGAHLLLGVANAALGFRQASIVSQDSGGRTAGLVYTKSTLSIPTLVPAGQVPPPVGFQITGGGQ
jgi:hypothetical protein